MYISPLMGHLYSMCDAILALDKYVFGLKQKFDFNSTPLISGHTE